MDNLPQNQFPEKYVPYSPEKSERDLLNKIYSDLEQDRKLKTQSHPLLSNRTLKQFWDTSNKDYSQFVQDTETEDDWFREYPSGITRDKANTFISNLVQKMILPQVFAQNTMQFIDRIISRVLRILLSWTVKNDGKPTESGHSKFVKATHKCVIEGTVHRLLAINQDKNHETTIIPNEEVFIPNLWQSNIQKQDHFIWYQENLTYDAVKMEFGELDTFKHVVPGRIHDFNTETPFMKDYVGTIVDDKRVHVIRAWYPVPGNKKPKKYFNVIINGVLMFPYDNKDAYRHGLYPISKWIFEFLDGQFYFGNSLPNKMRHDKKWADAYRTIIMNKGKLAMLPPMFAEDGLNIDGDVYVPAKITSITGKADQLKEVPGIKPITQGEVALLDVIQKSGDEASAAPVSSGMPSREQRTLGEVQMTQTNAMQLMSLFGLMLAFGVEQESYLILRNIIQFFPRKKINELSKVNIPNQQLSSGKVGTMEVIFENILNLSEEERLVRSKEIMLEEMKSKKSGENREITYIDPSYAESLELFTEVVANPVDRKSEDMERYFAIATYRELYFNNPGISQSAALRRTIRKVDPEAEDELIIEEPQVPMLPPGAEGTQEAPLSSVSDREMPKTRQPSGVRSAQPVQTMF